MISTEQLRDSGTITHQVRTRIEVRIMSSTRRLSLALSCLALGDIGGMMLPARLVGQPGVPALPPQQPRELASFSPVVKKVLPAVVSIEVKGKAAPKADAADFDNPGFGSGVII